MSATGIFKKLLRLCELTLSNTKSSIEIGKQLSESFHTKRGYRRGELWLCEIFNFITAEAILGWAPAAIDFVRSDVFTN